MSHYSYKTTFGKLKPHEFFSTVLCSEDIAEIFYKDGGKYVYEDSTVSKFNCRNLAGGIGNFPANKVVYVDYVQKKFGELAPGTYFHSRDANGNSFKYLKTQNESGFAANCVNLVTYKICYFLPGTVVHVEPYR